MKRLIKNIGYWKEPAINRANKPKLSNRVILIVFVILVLILSSLIVLGQTSFHRVDENKDGCIDTGELNSFIGRWKASSQDVSGN